LADDGLTESQAPRLNYASLASEQDARIKDDLINPTKRGSNPYYARLTRELRIANITPEDSAFWNEKIRLVTELCNSLDNYNIPIPAEMLWTETLAQLNLTASIKGFQLEHLGTTTGSSRTTLTQRSDQPPKV
jgi:hypothetical protein